jgi:hypothetical protein
MPENKPRVAHPGLTALGSGLFEKHGRAPSQTTSGGQMPRSLEEGWGQGGQGGRRGTLGQG